MQEVTITFPKGFYDESAVKTAMDAYEELAQFTYEQDKKAFSVHCHHIDEDFTPSEFQKEFSNYVLSVTILSYVENTL
jgi:hypothetical protein